MPGDPYADFRSATYSNEGLISEKDEIRLGARLHVEILKKFKLSQVGQNRLNQMARRLRGPAGGRSCLIDFFVIEIGR